MLQKGDKVSLFVTVVQPQGNLLKIWAQTNSESCQQIENLMTQSETELASRKPVMVRDVQVGDIFLAKFHEDNRWYRAKVCAVVPATGQVTVFFIDYGNEEVVGVTDIAKGREEHFQLPPQASPYLLADIESRGIQWTKEEIDGLSELLIYGEFEGTVVSVGTVGNPPTLRVTEVGSRQNYCVASSIIDAGYGKAAAPSNDVTLRQTVLEPGPNYHVYVVFYESPLNFWIQLVERQEIISKLEDAIVLEVKDSSPTASPITVGTVCVAKYRDVENNFETFYRSVVTNVLPDGKCEVLFVDYGNRETLSPQELKSMPARFNQLPSMAIQCCLHGSVSNAADFQRMLDSENMYARVRSVTNSGLHVVDLSEGLTQQTQIQPPPRQNGYGNISSPQNTNAPEAAFVKQYKPLQFNVGKQVDLCISHVENNGNYYCQLLENAPRLNQMMHTLDKMNNISNAPVTSTKQGMPCIARSNTDKNVYYRSKIIGPSKEPGKVEVQHVDFGVTEMVPSSYIFNIDEDLMDLPSQAIHCSLAGSDNYKSSAVYNTLKKYESKTALVGGVMLKSGSLYEMELVDTSGRQDVYIVKQLAADTGPDMSGYTSPTVTAGQWMDVEVTYVEDPSQVSCQFIKNKEDLSNLMDKIATYCDSGKAQRIQRAVLGLPCIAKYSEDGVWYRALISGVKASGETEVLFVDYGNHDSATPDSLRAIPPEFCQLPKQCISVSLDGIIHDSGWSEQETNVLFELAADESNPLLVLTVDAENYTAQLFDQSGQNINERFGCGIGKLAPNFINRGPVPKKVKGVYPSYNAKPPAAPSSPCPAPSSPSGGWAQWQANKPAPVETPKIGTIEVRPGYKDVIVEYVVDPNQFYCSLTGMADRVADMMEEINSENEGVGVPLPSIQQGAVYCAKFGDEWYRAEVVAVNGVEAKVKYFDYGNSEVISVRDIRALNPTHAKLPRQAIPCTLGGIAPVHGEWTPRAIAAFETLTNNDKNLVAAFTGQQKNGFYCVELIETVAGGQLMVHEELINAKHAVSVDAPPENIAKDALMRGSRSIRGSVRSPPPVAPSDTPILRFKLMKLPVAQTTDVNVVHLETPNLFWVQLTEYSAKLEKLMESLHDFYSVRDPQLCRVTSVSQGMACAARFSEDAEWYRAEVLNVTRGEVVVRYVDYGNVEKRPLSEIWAIQPHFMELPAQAIQCSLHGVTVPPTGWDQLAKETFEERVSDKNLLAEVVSVSPSNVFTIKLAEVVNNIPVLVAYQLVKSGVAAFSTPPMSPGRPVTGRPSPRQGNVSVDHPTRDTYKAPIVKQREQPPVITSYPDQNIKVGDKLVVNMVWLTSPTSFYCQAVKSQDQLKQLIENINEHYEMLRMSESAVTNPQPGQPCVAVFAADGNWYRSLVLRTRNREAEVLYVDFGNKDRMQWSKLKQIESRFLNLPPLAFHCALKDMDTFQGVFNEKVEKYFLGLMEQNLTVKVISLPKSVTECYTITLEDGSGKDATEHIAQLSGKGIPSRPEQVQPLSSAPPPRRVQPVASTPPRSSMPRELVLKMLDSPLRPGQQSNLIVSNIEDVSLFYCQLAPNVEGLDKFMETLEAHYSSGQGVPLEMSQVKSGMPCVAKFSDDGFWYRAKVRKPLPPNKVDVVFVDYGNSEETTLDNTCHLIPKFADYPIQAFQCSLKGVPTTGNNDALVYFRQLVEGKDLIGRVGDKRGAFVEVDLKVAESGVIVSAEMKKKFGQAPVPMGKVQIETFPRQQIPSSEESVYITNVDSPLSFWVQLESKETEIQELADNLFTDYSAFSANDHRLNKVAVGAACVAKFSEDEAWYRSCIESISGGQVCVRFIDYGNTDTVDKNDLKEVISKYLSIPPLAVHCRLHGVKVPQGGWTKDDKALLENLDSAVQASFCGSDCPVGVRLQLNGNNIAEKFGPVEEESNNNNVNYLPAPAPKGTVTAYASIIEDGFVYLQLASQEGSLETLSNRLQEVYVTMANNELTLPAVLLGAPCCARFSNDDAWYRAVVEDASSAEKVKVRFVDFGNAEMVTSTALKQITPELLRLPPLAFKRQLEGVHKPASGWPDQYNEKLEELLLDREITVTFVSDEFAKMQVDGQDISTAIKAHYPELSTEIKVRTSPVTASMKALTIQDQNCLEAGATVMVSEVVSPTNFFVQKVDTLDDLVEYMDTLDEACKGLAFVPSPEVGQFCCARFSEDEAIYRAVITNVGEQLKVRFVDYGNCDTVPHVLPLPEGHDVKPAYAGRYQLIGGTGDYPDEKVKMFSELVLEKELTIQEVVKDTDPPSLRLMDGQTDINLAMGCAPQGIETAKELPGQDVPAKKTSAYASHIEGLNEIYLQMAHESAILDQITDSLQVAYEEMEQNVNTLNSAEVGSLCCAKFSEDEAWYRAKIETTTGENIKVRFIDFGNSEETNIDSLKCLTPPFLKHAPLAFCCQLEGVDAPGGNTPETIKEKLEEALMDQQITATFNSTSPPYSVKMEVDETDVSDTIQAQLTSAKPDEVCLNVSEPVPNSGELPCVSEPDNGEPLESTEDKSDKLLDGAEPTEAIEEQLADTPSTTEAKSDELLDSAEPTEVVEEQLADTPSTTEAKSDELLDSAEPTETVGEKKADTPSTTEDKSDEPYPNVTEAILNSAEPPEPQEELADTPSICEIVVGEKVIIPIVDSNHIFIRCVDREENDLKKFMEELKVLSESQNPLPEVKTNLMCLALNTEDDMWYRARITSEGEDTVGVLFVDYGISHLLPIENLRCIPEEIEKRPHHVHTCQLLGADNQWTESQVEQFQKITQDKEFLVKDVNTNTQPLSVRLLDGETDLSSLISSLSESEEEFVETSDEVKEEKVEDMDLKVISGSNSASVSGEQSSEDEFADAEDGHEKQTEDQVSTSGDIVVGNKFQVEVLHIISPSKFWCQLSRGTNEQEMIREVLVESGASGDSLHDPVIGQMCAAKYEDGDWYRAKIVSLGEEKVTAFFVDYGSTEEVYKSDLRTIPEALFMFKHQAITCQIHGVRPTDDMWTSNAKLRFEELVQEKELLAEVMSIKEYGGHSLHSLKLLDMGISVAQRLKDEGHAIDGDVQQKEDGTETIPTLESPKSDVTSPDKSEEYTYRDLDQAKATLTFGTEDDIAELEEILLPTAPDLSIGERVEVTVVHVESFKEIYFQLKAKKMTIDVLTDDMIEAYEDNSSHLSDEVKSSLRVGSVCAANSAVDECWYRAEIKQVDGDEITVQFVDFGNTEKIDISALQLLKPKFHSHTKQAHICSLHGADDISPDLLEKFTSVLVDKTVLAVVEDVSDGKPHITFLDMGIDVCKMLVDEIDGGKEDDKFVAEDGSDDGQPVERAGEEDVKEIKDGGVEETITVSTTENEATHTEKPPTEALAATPVDVEAGEEDEEESEDGAVAETITVSTTENKIKPVEEPATEVLGPTPVEEETEIVEGIDSGDVSDLSEKVPVVTCTETEAVSLPVEEASLPPKSTLEAGDLKKESQASSEVEGNEDSAGQEAEVTETKPLDDQAVLSTEQLTEEGAKASQENMTGKGKDEDIGNDNPTEGESDKHSDDLMPVESNQPESIEEERKVVDEDEERDLEDQNSVDSDLDSTLEEKKEEGCTNESLTGEEGKDECQSHTELEDQTPTKVDDLESPSTCTEISNDEQIAATCNNDDFIEANFNASEQVETPNQEPVVTDQKKGESHSEINDEGQIKGLVESNSGDDPEKGILSNNETANDLKMEASVKDTQPGIGEEKTEEGILVKSPVVKEDTSECLKGKISYNYPSFEGQDMLNVYAALATSPGKFWCQLIKPSTTNLPLLSDGIQDHCSTSDTSLPTESLLPGMPCIAKCSLDKNWYRGLITQISGDDVSVFYVDYGNSEDTNVKDLKPMVPEFLELDVQAFQCRLAGIVSNDGNDWDDTSAARFDELVTDKDLQLKIKDKVMAEDGTLKELIVDLWDSSTSISQALIDGGYAQASPKPTLDEDEVPEEPEVKEESEGIKVIVSDADKQVEGGEGEVREWEYVPLEPTTVLDVVFHRGENPDDFVLHAKEESANLKELLQKIAAEEREGVTDVKVGMPVLVDLKRARILAVAEDKCKVEYIDDGYCEDIEPSSLRQLNGDEDVAVGPQAIKSRLAGIEAETWSEEALDFFKGLKCSKNLSARVAAVHDDIHDIYLYDMDDESGTSMNALMVFKGFAWVIADSELSVERAEEELLTDLGESESSFLEVNEGRRQSFGSLADSESDEDEADDSLDFTRPELKPGDKVEVEFLSAVDPENITFHLKSAREKLADLSKLLEVSTHRAAILTPHQLRTGMACLALSENGTYWRRAKVLTKDGSSIAVHHVDYGSVETVSRENLRLINEACLLLPTQAIMCGIAGVKPTHGTWHSECAAIIRKACIDQENEPKSVSMEMVSRQGDDLHLVQLKTSDNQDIGDLLVDEGYAVRQTEATVESNTDIKKETDSSSE